MSERTFRIYENTVSVSPWTDPKCTITESELESRINAIVSIAQGPYCSMTRLKNIYIYGEAKEVENE